jgi:hypothetical protein
MPSTSVFEPPALGVRPYYAPVDITAQSDSVAR